MNLHLCKDEKVITRTIRYFEEALPGQNKFIVYMPQMEETSKYVKEKKPYVFYVHYNTKEFWEAVGDVTGYKNIIIHFLSEEACDFLQSVPKGVDITWIIWGADLYNDLLAKRGYALYANSAEKECAPLSKRIIKCLKYPVTALNQYRLLKNRIKAIRKVKHVCSRKGYLKLLYEYFPEVQPLVQRKFFYYPVDDIIGDSLKDANINGNNIIVGNSASFSNNHQYVFNILKDYNLGNRKVITPLSYGGNRDVAIKAGQVLGENFHPLVDFISLEDYNKILASASTFIYGNFRPEAVGNLVIAFYLGAAVFLDERNPLLSDLRERGYILYGFKDLPEKLDYELSSEERSHNRELVLKLNNRELMLSYIKESFA